VAHANIILSCWFFVQKQIVTRLRSNLQEAMEKTGKVPVRFIKILFTGSGAAGKTSFSNLLMRKAINKLHHSTNVVQAKHAISVRKAVAVGSEREDKSVIWIEMDSDSEIAHLRQTLLAKKSEATAATPQTNPVSDSLNATNIGIQESKRNDSSAKKPEQTREMLSSSRRTATRRRSSLSLTQSLTNIFPRSRKLKTERLRTFDDLVKSALVAGSSHQVTKEILYHHGEVLNIITLLDTGGQPEYIHLLPTINIHPMVTFVVHDLSKSLDDQVLVEYSEHGKHVFEPYHLRYSNFDMIKFLMSTINDSLERPVCQVPQLFTIPGKNTSSYICLVGTHADQVSSNVICSADSKLTELVEMLDCKAAVWPNKDEGVLFPVDNTTAGSDFKEDPIAKLIRNKIELLSSDKDVYMLPISWMLFDLEIRQVCFRSKKAYISFEDCVSIASKSNLITNVYDVISALLYHHLLGVLLYYPNVPGLCDYVIVDHQWLFDRLSSIVRFTFKDSLNLHAANKLKYNGILCKELMEEFKWEEELKEEYFIALLVEMKIIAPIQREDGSGEDYFIPYVLPTYTSQSLGDDILSQYGYLQGEPLLIQFISNLLPRGFFCCLVVQLLQRLPHGWRHCLTIKDNIHSYSNLITFRLPSAYFLSLVDKISYLEVQIRHREIDYYQQYPVHFGVQDVLACALEIVCEQLSYNHGRLQYGFHCQCGDKGEHIAMLTRLLPPFDYALCRYGSMVDTKLNQRHTVWLLEVR